MAKKFYFKDQKVKAHSRKSPKSNKKIQIQSYSRKQKFRKYLKISQKEAKELFDKKSERSKSMDLKTTANKVLTIPDERWAENTGRSDVRDIDTKPEIQERYLLVADFLGKKPEEMKSWEYMGFIGKMSGLYEKTGRDKTITDQEDFTNFIKEYIKKNTKKEKPLAKKSEYFLDNRPIDIGTVPDSDKIIKSESWNPSKDNNFTFGSIEYNSELTFEQIYKFELRPKDEVEYANYMFWLKNDKDLAKAERMKNRYLDLSLEELKEWRNKDPFSNYAYLIKKNKKEKPKKIKFENLPYTDKLAINDKVYEDEAVANLDQNIELMKRGMGKINKRVSEGEHRQLPKETMDKLYKNQLSYKKDIEDAEKQLTDRVDLLIDKYVKELKSKSKPKPKKDMTLTEDEYAMSKLGGSSDKRSYIEYLDDSKIPREEYAKYYDKKMKQSDKISNQKLKKLKEQILEIERKGNRNSRLDIILQYPQGEQKELVEKYKKAQKRYTTVHSREFDFKLQKRFKEIKGLPDLKPDQKYYVVMVRDSGWVDHIGYKKQKEDAVDERVINDLIFKNMRKDVKGKVEIVLAKNIEDVRKQVRSRGRENYLITGDTYKQKGKIRSIARVKFDYGKKGYIGELSPKELEELKKLTGIEIKKTKSLTKTDLKASKIAKAHSKSSKYVRHKRVKGSIWQKEEPFTKKQNALEHSLTWIFKIGDDRNRLNTDFNNYTSSKKNQIKEALNLKQIEDAPEDVLNAYDRYRKAVYNKILSDLNSNRIAPSTVITGGSNYRGNMPKRIRYEKNAYERFKRVDTAVDKVIKQYQQL